jgi:hypothetical protein
MRRKRCCPQFSRFPLDLPSRVQFRTMQLDLVCDLCKHEECGCRVLREAAACLTVALITQEAREELLSRISICATCGEEQPRAVSTLAA